MSTLAVRHARLGPAVLDSLPIGLAVVERDRVVVLNRRVGEIFQLDVSSFIGQDPEALYRALSKQIEPAGDHLTEMIAASQQAASGQHLQLRLGREGNASVIDLEWFSLGENGYGLLMRDVTRERELDEMKSQLLSTVSHEFRTPLASIKGFATTLLREDVKWDLATQRDFLRIIEEETDRLSELIDNLLDMSQIEVGVLRVTPEPLQLRPIIREVVDEMRMRTEQHWFVLDLPADLPRVWGDSRRLRQVMRNLIENALKYSPQGGQVTISCEVLAQELQVRVADQGEGIPSEYLERIFERFFQVNGSSTRKAGGSGLGLSIAKGIIEAHRGRIWAESNPGQGSAFYFTLPLVSAELLEGSQEQ